MEHHKDWILWLFLEVINFQFLLKVKLMSVKMFKKNNSEIINKIILNLIILKIFDVWNINVNTLYAGPAKTRDSKSIAWAPAPSKRGIRSLSLERRPCENAGFFEVCRFSVGSEIMQHSFVSRFVCSYHDYADLHFLLRRNKMYTMVQEQVQTRVTLKHRIP